MERLKFIAVLLIFFCTNKLLAQKIDISGKWKLNIEKTEFGGIPSYAAWQQMEIDQKNDKIDITYINVDAQGVEKKNIAALTINGEPEIKLLNEELSSSRSIASSPGDEGLIITTKYTNPKVAGDVGYSIVQKISLQDTKKIMNVTMITEGYTLKLIYNKISAGELSKYSHQVLPLYKDEIPNSIGKLDENNKPALELFLPEKQNATGTAVIIFPGGAYSFLAYAEEGTVIAKSFAEKGIASIVVKYRLPNAATMHDKSTGPLMDAQQAIKTVRENAAGWNLDTAKIGVIGYSAGGHLASTAGTHFNKSYIPNKENTNLRPNFMILVYPVISMKENLTHLGSRISLLGMEPSEKMVTLFSNELQVTEQTPPTYLAHTGDDIIVDVNNSIVFYQALQKKRVDAELHLYPKGNHGFTQHLLVKEWMDPMLAFLTREGF